MTTYSSEHTGGDCYEAAGRFMMDFIDKESDYILVHGEVTGTGGEVEGVKFGHAWIEVDGMVLDKSNGKDVALPKYVYYRIGGIGMNTHEYTAKEAAVKMLETGIWGPWDLETESGL